MTFVEMGFPVLGRTLPQDHAYDLYSAISHLLGCHLANDIAILPIRGISLGIEGLRITPASRLRIRLPAERIGEILPLAGKFLNIAGHELGLGVPEVRALEPASILASRLVTIKGYQAPEPFLVAVERQMAELEIHGRATIPVFKDGPRTGEHRRRVLKIKNRTVVGFALQVDGLSNLDSYKLLVHGLGGRRHMGCGIFFPVRDQEEKGDGNTATARQR